MFSVKLPVKEKVNDAINNKSFSPLSGMKRPFSPPSVLEMEEDRSGLGVGMGLSVDSEVCCDTQEEGVVLGEQPGPVGGALPSSDHSRPKRERKQRSYTLCDVCNIQLNSPAQAQIHYNGKSHQKRLKQISNGKIQHGNTGRTSHPLSALFCSCTLLYPYTV